MDIGLNLAKPSHGLPCPFIDRCQWADQPRLVVGSGPGSINAMGWPVGPGRYAAQYPIDPGTRKYTLIVTRGTISQIAVPNPKATVKIVNNEATFDITGATPGFSVAMTITVTGNDEARWAIIPAELRDAWSANPQAADESWLAPRRGIAVVRAMDWMGANDNMTGIYTPGPIGSFGQLSRGVPIEAITEIGNTLNVSPWINFPVASTDDTIRDIADRAIKQSKKPPRFELGNEIWEGGNQGHTYALAQALSGMGASPKDVDRSYIWYGYRAVQVSRLIQSLGYKVGVDFHMCLGVQSMQLSKAPILFTGFDKAGGVNADFNKWIMTGYINGTMTTADDIVIPWVRDNNIDAAIDNILHGENFSRPDPKNPGKFLAPNSGVSLDAVKRTTAKHVAIAQPRGWDVEWYEGNIHLNTIPHYASPNIAKYPAAVAAGITQQKVSAFFKAVYNSPQAAAVMTANLQAAADAGVKLAVLFNDASPWSDNGGFGLIGTPGWDAARAWVAKKPAFDPVSFQAEIADMQAKLSDLVARFKAAGF